MTVVDDTKSAVELAVREAVGRQGLSLLAESPKPLKFQDERGSSLTVSATECTTGWSLRRSGQSCLAFEQVWSPSAQHPSPSVHFNLNHIDPTVRSFTFKVSTLQDELTDNKMSFSVHVRIPDPPGTGGLHGTVTSLGSSSGGGVGSPIRVGGASRGQRNSHRGNAAGAIATSTPNKAFTRMSSSSSGSSKSSHAAFKLPSNLKLRLCKALDSPPAKGLNDWRALAAGLRLEKFTPYLSAQQSPTECILNLWEVQSAANSAFGNPIGDLLTLLKAIGRRDVATMIEQELVSPWV